MRSHTGVSPYLLLALLLALPPLLLLAAPASTQVEEDEEVEGPPLVVDAAGTVSAAEAVSPSASAVIRFDELVAKEARTQATAPGPERTWMPIERQHPAEPYFPPAPGGGSVPKGLAPLVASPSPLYSFMGLDDVPMADSSYIVIPPDVGGAVGPTHVMEGFNNNYRIQDKATGTTLATLGTATFWASVVAPSERLNLTDPRTVYDPYNDCWIAAMQTYTSGAGKLLVGVSQTSDPQGAWYLYSFNTGATIDFPILGFNKNWISISVNRYGTFLRGINLVLDYPMARAGTGTGTLFTHSPNTHFCSSPCVTYSSTAETLYVVTHLSSAGATYEVDTITGTAGSPTYTSGGTSTRTGGGWAQPGGNILPQSAPVAGSSACGAPPCPLECQDSQVRSAPVYRDGSIYYTQTIGLPAGGYTHTAVQWTQIATPGGAFVDGGRVDDPTATSSNGGLWYAYPHIAVNAAGDFLVGFSQFSSAQHPSAGYVVHVAGDGAGTLRDPLVYHAGEDYYHKTFDTATGRNRWGDFSTAQVDPSDDMTLWTLQEYAKARTGTNDGNTGANSSRWSSWWAGVSTTTTPTYTITASAGAGGSITPSGDVMVAEGADTTFTITPDSCSAIADVLVDAMSVGPLSSYPFPNVMADHTIEAVFTPLPDDTISASAGPGGSITPSGQVPVACGADQMFSFTPDPGFSIQDVQVDSASVGTPPTYTFPNVQENHTIYAGFADTEPPSCAVTFPNGGDTLHVATTRVLSWTASDNDTVTCLDLLLSRSGSGGPYDTLATCLPDTGSYAWDVDLPITYNAVFRILVHDASGNVCDDESDGEFLIAGTETGVADLPGTAVTAFAMTLHENPIHGQARLTLAVPQPGRMRVAVFDVSGREVAVLEDRDFEQGRHEITWNTRVRGSRAPAGLYFIRATGLGRTLVNRVVVTE